jgi:DNA-binding NarL/FixJ family response regulator
MTILVVSDLRPLREGLISLLAEQQDIIVIGASTSNDNTLEKIKLIRPSMVLIDIGTADSDAITLARCHSP